MLRLRVKEGYFLSEEDFSNVYGSPLLNGLYAPLEDRETTTRRYIALSRDEADVFGASVGHAISGSVGAGKLPKNIVGTFSVVCEVTACCREC
jgi:hypothetical protein